MANDPPSAARNSESKIITITGVCTDIMRKTMSHLAELVASAKAAINEASDVAALDNVRVEYLGKKGS
jgi:phenylalanyl-tRNA synthetase alpha chain